MKFVKRCFTAALAVCLLVCAVCPVRGESAEPPKSFLLKIWNQTGLEISYLRFDYFLGDEQQGYVLCCPDEGEDFYRFEVSEDGLYSLETGKELKDFRAECAYCISELNPEEAILSAMMGKEMDETWFQTLELEPVFGEEYEYLFTGDGEGCYMLRLKEDGTDAFQPFPEDAEENLDVAYVYEGGLYVVDGSRTFMYRKTLTGRNPGAEYDSMYIVLTNNPEITFDMVGKSLYSSRSEDHLTDTVLIGMHVLDENGNILTTESETAETVSEGQ